MNRIIIYRYFIVSQSLASQNYDDQPDENLGRGSSAKRDLSQYRNKRSGYGGGGRKNWKNKSAAGSSSRKPQGSRYNKRASSSSTAGPSKKRASNYKNVKSNSGSIPMMPV